MTPLPSLGLPAKYYTHLPVQMPTAVYAQMDSNPPPLYIFFC